MGVGGTVEQRRSERRECQLQVEVVDGQRRLSTRSINVSRHGLLLAVDAPLEERFLVQLVLQLPDGPLSATGFVVRRTAPGARPAGVGLQFFALSAASKQRWDHFVYGLTGAHTPSPDLGGQAPEQATFLIKLRDHGRLAEFVERNVTRGALYMATPVIKPEGTGIALVLVHPESEEEYLISGEVARVCREPPKGMEVRFTPPDLAELARIWDFVRTGNVQRPPPTPVAPLPAPVPSPKEPSQDIPIDIEVEQSALDESARFSWDDVSDYRMVLDFELANQNTLDLRPRVDRRLEVTMEVPAVGRLSTDAAVTLEVPAPPELRARARRSGDLPVPTRDPGVEAPQEPEAAGTSGAERDPVVLAGRGAANARQAWRWPSPAGGLPSAPPAPEVISAPPQVLELGLEETPDLPDPERAPTAEELQIPILEPVVSPLLDDLPILEPVEGDFDKVYAPHLEAAITGSLPRLPRAELERDAPSGPWAAKAVGPGSPGPAPDALDLGGAGLEVEGASELAPPEAVPLPVPEAEAEAEAALEAELDAQISAALAAEAAAEPPGLSLPVAQTVRVYCAGCDAELGVVRLGPADGFLGLVAESKPYWNPERRSLVTVLRPRSSEERGAAKAAMQDALTEPVPLELLFTVVELNRPPADPETGGRVRVNSLVRAVWAAQGNLHGHEPQALPTARCPCCRAGPVLAELSPARDTPPR